MAKPTDVLNLEHPKQLARKHYVTIPAKDPRDGGTWDLLLPPSLLEETKLRGLGRCKELAFTVRLGVLNIRHVFRGVRDTETRLGCDEWLSYVSTPSRAYDYKTGEERKAWENSVFCVFVTDERLVINFYWCDCDPNDPTLPMDHELRFIERVF